MYNDNNPGTVYLWKQQKKVDYATPSLRERDTSVSIARDVVLLEGRSTEFHGPFMSTSCYECMKDLKLRKITFNFLCINVFVSLT